MNRDHSISSIGRKNKNVRTNDRFIVFTEGRNTEPDYIKLLKRSNCLIEPFTIKGNGIGSCVDFVEKQNAKFNSYSKAKRDSFKQKWMIFDNDGRPDFVEAVKKAVGLGYKVAFSNMCIEYWFLLHFTDNEGDKIPLKGNSHSQAQIDEINKYINSYNKKAITGAKVYLYDDGSKSIKEDFFDLMLAIDPITHNHRVEDAFIRAKKIHENKKRNGNEYAESVTTMYSLLQELGVISMDDEGNYKLQKY